MAGNRTLTDRLTNSEIPDSVHGSHIADVLCGNGTAAITCVKQAHMLIILQLKNAVCNILKISFCSGKNLSYSLLKFLISNVLPVSGKRCDFSGVWDIIIFPY